MNIPKDDPREQARTKLLKKFINSAMKDGFQQLRMEDISKLMDVSRATMYKHFSSKEEIIAGVVQIIVDYIAKLEDWSTTEDERLYGVWFQKQFEQSVSLADKISESFLKDLQSAYPELYDLMKSAMNRQEEKSLTFYKDGKDKGIFNPINEKLFMLQDSLMIREILNVKYLIANQLSMKQVLYDYYLLKKIQLFKADKMILVDDALIDPVIEHVVEKFNRSL
jgi:AcrR family transcriptional regulator